MKIDNAGGLGRYGEPAVLILLSLAQTPKHGYAIMQDLEENVNVKIGPGTLYGAISKLREKGLIEALPEEERTRPYRLTEAGRTALRDFVGAWNPIIDVAKLRLA